MHPTTSIATGAPGDDGRASSPRPRKLGLFRWLPDTWVLTRCSAHPLRLYLTFDDGPDPEHTPRLLDLLAAHGARATFFVIGEHAQRHPAIMRRLVAEGHALGNHSWSHPHIERLPAVQQRDQVERTDRLLQQYDGRASHDFRPPRGATPIRLLLDFLWRRGRVAYWSYDSLDYSRRPIADLLAGFRQHPVRSGDIVLMHDDSDHSFQLLQALLPEWTSAGYAMETIPVVAGR